MRIPLSSLPLPLFVLFRNVLAQEPNKTCLLHADDPSGRLRAQCPAGLPAVSSGDRVPGVEDARELCMVTYPGMNIPEKTCASPDSKEQPPQAKVVPTGAETGTDDVRQGRLTQADETTFLSFEAWKEKQVHELEAALQSHSVAAADKEKEKELNLNERIEDALRGQIDRGGRAAEQKHIGYPLRSRSALVAGDSGNKSTSSSSKQSSSSTASAPARSTSQSHRYNYASPDCSARIHSSSRYSQNPSSILHKSKDRYMLTPCGAKEHWVVIELCDDIRIEGIELGMFEFFSGVVRDVEVSVGGADEEDEEEEMEVEEESVDQDDVLTEGQPPSLDARGNPIRPALKRKSREWTPVGRFTSRNVRGSQSFSLSHPTSFQRFVRLEFPTHYGNEYYCPISSVKVYGMNQMEAYKWEEKRRRHEEEERRRAAVAVPASMTTTTIQPAEQIIATVAEPSRPITGDPNSKKESTASTHVAAASNKATTVIESAVTASSQIAPVEQARYAETNAQTASAGVTADQVSSSSKDNRMNNMATQVELTTSTAGLTGGLDCPPGFSSEATTLQFGTPAASSLARGHRPGELSEISSVTLSALPNAIPPIEPVPVNIVKTNNGVDVTVADSQTHSLPMDASLLVTSSEAFLPTITRSSSQASVPTPAQQSPPYRQPPRADSSESIYAYIIRRLDALEGNTTLATLYIEQQTRSTQLMLTRLEHSFESWRDSMTAEMNRTLSAERLRSDRKINQALARLQQKEVALEKDRFAYNAQLRGLADDILLEKRRGIAQLVFTLVLVIIAAVTQARQLDGSIPAASNGKIGRRALTPHLAMPSAAAPLGLDGGMDSAKYEPGETESPSLRSPSLRTPRRFPTAISAKSFSRQTPGSLARSRYDVDAISADRQRMRYSSGVPSIPPRKLARSAHLHYVDLSAVRKADRTNSNISLHPPAITDTTSDPGGEESGHQSPFREDFGGVVGLQRPPTMGELPVSKASEGACSASEVDSDFHTDDDNMRVI